MTPSFGHRFPVIHVHLLECWFMKEKNILLFVAEHNLWQYLFRLHR
jgi:hypothetical protein